MAQAEQKVVGLEFLFRRACGEAAVRLLPEVGQRCVEMDDASKADNLLAQVDNNLF